MNPSVRPYTWRQAIQKSTLPSTTKHVLLNLSCYINDAGQAAFPSIDQQAEDTGLSRRAVITHLKSVEGSWLSVSKHGYAGQKWARNEYLPRLPDEPDLDVKAVDCSCPDLPAGAKGGERGSPPFAEKVGRGGERGSPPSGVEGGEPDDKKAVNVVHSNRPVEQTITPPYLPKGGELLAITGEALRRWFDEAFWPKYPKRVGRSDALIALERLRPDEILLAAIAEGLDHRLAGERHAKARNAFFPAWPDAHRWLRKRKWEDRFDVPRETGGAPRCQCGAIGVVGDGRRWYCRAHDPDRRPSA